LAPVHLRYIAAMLWLFSATPSDLRAALPTWVDAIAEPAPKEQLNPFTRERVTALTYNPDPDGAYEEPPEEAPPPFPHAIVWEPEPRVGWSTLYVAVTGDTEPQLGGGDLFDPGSPAARLLYREVICGRPGAPCICHVPESLRSGLLGMTTGTIPALAELWTRLARERVSRPVDARQWLPYAEETLRGIERWAALLTDRRAPWLVWEDGYDW